MKTIDEEKKQAFDNFAIVCAIASESIDNKQIAFDSGWDAAIEFSQRWIEMNELKEVGVEMLFKDKKSKCCVGKFEFIESKLCITTDISYSILEDSGFIYFRPIELK